jgi:dihydrofolate synthase/folylpolyglutamate synthase
VQALPASHPLAPLLREPAIVRAGLAATRWPGRLERVWPSPLPPPIAVPPDREVWLDAAHNPEGAQALMRWLDEQPQARPLTVLFGLVRGKRLGEMTAPLRRAEHLVLTRPPSPRGRPAHEVQAELALPLDRSAVEEDWTAALRLALAQTPAGGRLLVYGSIFLVAAVRGWFRQEPSDDLSIQDPGAVPAP